MAKKKNIFNVIIWDFNRKKFEPHDIMPYLRDCYKKAKKSRRKKTPETIEEFTEFAIGELSYRYCGRTEYEVILLDWPCQETTEKIDIYDQCKMNLDLIVRLLMEDVTKNAKLNNK